MDIVSDGADLRIAKHYVGSPLTVVTFSGAKRRIAGQTSHEFLRSLRSQASNFPLPNIISVIDKSTCWYNNGLTDRIADIVNETIIRQSCTRTITLGASMGGLGAVVCARSLLRCTLAIAFGAHFSVHPKIVPFDTRSKEQRAKITSWDYIDAGATLNPAIKYELIYGSEFRIDRMHAFKFLRRGLANLSVRFIAEADHNVASYLRGRGELHPFIMGTIWDAPEAIRAALSHGGSITKERGAVIKSAPVPRPIFLPAPLSNGSDERERVMQLD